MTPDDAWRIQSSWRSGPVACGARRVRASRPTERICARTILPFAHCDTPVTLRSPGFGFVPSIRDQVGSSVPVITRRAARHLQRPKRPRQPKRPLRPPPQAPHRFHWSLQFLRFLQFLQFLRVSRVGFLGTQQNGTRRRMPRHTSGSDRAAVPPAARGSSCAASGSLLPRGAVEVVQGDGRRRAAAGAADPALLAAGEVRRGPGQRWGCRPMSSRPTSFRRGSSG